MKIALVIEHLDHRRGGAETYVHGFAAWLLRQGHGVAIVTQDAHEPPEGAEVQLIEAAGPTRRRRTVGFARAAREALLRLRADTSMATGKALGMRVYQPHGGTVRGSERQNLARVPSEALRSAKMVWNRLSPKHRAFRRLEAEQFAGPQTHFVAISEMVRRDMRTFYGVAEHRISLVYNGIDVERFHPDRVRPHRDAVRRRYGIPDGSTLLLMVAHNPKLKGLRETILALARLKGEARESVHLLVVGRGGKLRFRRLAEKLGIAPRVTLAGPEADAAPLYGAADVYVQPTWYDPCSLVALEALASGLPVVTTRFNGAGELMDGRDAGLVLDAPRPVARLAEALEALLDPERRRRMGQAARRVAEEHSEERNFREMLNLLERTARDARKA